MAAKLGITAGRIGVTGVRQGSLIVDFEVQSSATDTLQMTGSAFDAAMVGDIPLQQLSSDSTLQAAGVDVPASVSASSVATAQSSNPQSDDASKAVVSESAICALAAAMTTAYVMLGVAS